MARRYDEDAANSGGADRVTAALRRINPAVMIWIIEIAVETIPFGIGFETE